MNTLGILAKLLLYVKNRLKDPIMIPPSSAIKRVPAPTPLLVLGDKSAVQANKVGLEIPVAIPKITEPAVYMPTEVLRPIIVIASTIKLSPITSEALRPILSDKPPENTRIQIVDII